MGIQRWVSHGTCLQGFGSLVTGDIMYVSPGDTSEARLVQITSLVLGSPWIAFWFIHQMFHANLKKIYFIKFTWHLPCARHCSKNFTIINALNPQSVLTGRFYCYSHLNLEAPDFLLNLPLFLGEYQHYPLSSPIRTSSLHKWTHTEISWGNFKKSWCLWKTAHDH